MNHQRLKLFQGAHRMQGIRSNARPTLSRGYLCVRSQFLEGSSDDCLAHLFDRVFFQAHLFGDCFGPEQSSSRCANGASVRLLWRSALTNNRVPKLPALARCVKTATRSARCGLGYDVRENCVTQSITEVLLENLLDPVDHYEGLRPPLRGLGSVAASLCRLRACGKQLHESRDVSPPVRSAPCLQRREQIAI